MKSLVIPAVLLSGLVALAQYQEGDTNVVLTVGDRTITRGELQEKIRRHQAKKHGGIIVEENSAKGYFAFLNAQGKVPLSEIEKLEPMIDKWLRFRTLYKETSDVTASNVKAKIADAGGTVGVAVVEAGDAPMLMTAPEDGWALVNVTRLAADNPSQEVLSARVRKEALRGMAFVTGCAYMTKADPLMRDVKTLDDLDHLPVEQFGLEIVNHVVESAKFYGLHPWNRTTYRKACEQGWAPSPTNDTQRAIWEEIKGKRSQIPTKPMKITPGMQPKNK